jgi:DNA-binding PadR family transcriptional regulator
MKSTRRKRAPSAHAVAVLMELAKRPVWRYGYEVGAETGLKTGTIYPILIRLKDRGLVEAKWKHVGPRGRPPRHMYRLTVTGRELAREYKAAGVPAVKPRLRKRKTKARGG